MHICVTALLVLSLALAIAACGRNGANSIRQQPDGTCVLGWTGTSAAVYVEFNSTLDPDQWQTIAGPVSGSFWTNAPPAAQQGFFRLRVE